MKYLLIFAIVVIVLLLYVLLGWGVVLAIGWLGGPDLAVWQGTIIGLVVSSLVGGASR